MSVISSEMSATASEELLKAHAVISRSWLLKPILASPQPSPKEREKSVTQIHPETSHGAQFLPFGEVGRGVIKWYERDAHTNFDVCADDHCQRYQGITRASTEAVRKAIAETRGEVLIYDNEICDARFSKSCGGISETFENCWAPVHYPYLLKIIDNPVEPDGYELDLTIEEYAEKWIRNAPPAFCNTSDKNILAQVLNNYDQETTDFYRWKVEYNQSEISELIKRKSGIDFGKIIDLIPVKRGESGRLIELKIVGTKQSIIVGKELEIRKWLSDSHLYSSAFVVDKFDTINGIPQKFQLVGAGWGHGVGLCQIGAAVMAEKGYKYDEILMHYFKDAQLQKIYQ
jgi:SpoIID/LytB domain protein